MFKNVMREADRRVKRTKNLLRNALIGITLEKGYEPVTIREITERADVGYATFFRHYQDKNALLIDVLNVLVTEIEDLLEPLSNQPDPEKEGTLIFRHAQANSRLYHVLLNSCRAASILSYIRKGSVEEITTRQKPKDESLIPAQVAANHLVSSIMALIRWWLENDMPYPPEMMGKIYSELIYKPTHALSFQ